jgi:hypothetical protein
MTPSYSHTYSSVEPRTRMLLDESMMSEILADVGRMRTATELELWASWILGQTWKQRTRQPLFTEVDWSLTVGAPMVAMIAGIGGARARKALTAISMLDRGALGNYAGAIALTLPGARTPGWMADMANARLIRARTSESLAEPGDFMMVFFDLERRGRHELTVAVSVDEASDERVEWIQLCGPVPTQLDLGEAETAAMEEIDLPSAAARVVQAIAATDRDPRARVSPQFADLRAFLLARVLDASGA